MLLLLFALWALSFGPSLHGQSPLSPVSPPSPSSSSFHAVAIPPRAFHPFAGHSSPSVTNGLFHTLFNHDGLDRTSVSWQHLLAHKPTAFVQPWSEVLTVTTPLTCDWSIGILQNLLNRASEVTNKVNPITSCYDEHTAEAVKEFQMAHSSGLHIQSGLLGQFDGATSQLLMRLYENDGYVDSGDFPEEYQWKVHIPVFPNRFVDTVAQFTLRIPPTSPHAPPDGSPPSDWIEQFYFVVKTAGQPSADGLSDMRSQFASNGSTLTGLYKIEFTSPHPETKDYGPWPINSAMEGIDGNAGMKVFFHTYMTPIYPAVHKGVYLHTGYWMSWPNPARPLPVSHGCVHTHPNGIKHIADVLAYHGIEAAQHGRVYKPRGLMSVELITTPDQEITALQYQKSYWMQNNQISNHEFVLGGFDQDAMDDAQAIISGSITDPSGPNAGAIKGRRPPKQFIHLLDTKIAFWERKKKSSSAIAEADSLEEAQVVPPRDDLWGEPQESSQGPIHVHIEVDA